MSLTYLIDEKAAGLNGLVSDFIKGGLGAMPEFARGDEVVPVTIRTLQRSNVSSRAYDDTWQSGDVLFIGIGYAPTNLALTELTTELPAASVTRTLTQAASSTANQTYTISFTEGTYGGLYSISATVNTVTASCGTVGPLATPQQLQAVLLNHPQLTTSNVLVSQSGDSFVIEFIGNLSGPAAPTITVTNVSLLAPVGASGDLTLNTDEMEAAFEATSANYLDLPFEIMRIRGDETKGLFNGTVRVHRSVIDPGSVLPVPSLALDAYIAARAVCYDRAQTLTTLQKAQARENINAAEAGGSSGITINSTTVTGAAAGDVLISDGTLVQKLTPGTGVSAALAQNVNGASGLLALTAGGNIDLDATAIVQIVTLSPAVGNNLNLQNAQTVAAGAISFDTAGGSVVLTIPASATISGTNTGDQTTITGNAGTATALQTPRSIYGSNFDGTAALSGPIAGTYGGTGVNNSTRTITIAGNLVTTGAFNTTFAAQATATHTLPASSSTLARTDASQTFTGTQTVTGDVKITDGTHHVFLTSATTAFSTYGLKIGRSSSTSGASVQLGQLSVFGDSDNSLAPTIVVGGTGSTGNGQLAIYNSSAPSLYFAAFHDSLVFGTGTYSSTIARTAATANRTFTLPDQSGTAAVTNDITGNVLNGSFTGLTLGGDAKLKRVAANVIGVSDGTSAQEFRVYNTSDNAHIGLKYVTNTAQLFVSTGNLQMRSDATTGGSNYLICGSSGTNEIYVGGTSRLSISSTALTLADATNFVFNTTTGTKIGTATTQKLAFWNATPIVQPTTSVASATVASPGAGTNIKTDDTFDGYTIAQVVKALRNEGLLA